MPSFTSNWIYTATSRLHIIASRVVLHVSNSHLGQFSVSAYSDLHNAVKCSRSNAIKQMESGMCIDEHTSLLISIFLEGYHSSVSHDKTRFIDRWLT